MYHGGGGFKHSEVYNMPVWLRLFHIQKINEFNQEKNKAIEKANKGQSPKSGNIARPNINPSSTYNF